MSGRCVLLQQLLTRFCSLLPVSYNFVYSWCLRSQQLPTRLSSRRVVVVSCSSGYQLGVSLQKLLTKTVSVSRCSICQLESVIYCKQTNESFSLSFYIYMGQPGINKILHDQQSEVLIVKLMQKKKHDILQQN